MDTETLKELIAAFQELGGEAKEAFVWYLLVTHGLGKLISLTWTLIGGAVLFGIYRLVRWCLLEEQVTFDIGVERKKWTRDLVTEARTVLQKHFKAKNA